MHNYEPDSCQQFVSLFRNKEMKFCCHRFRRLSVSQEQICVCIICDSLTVLYNLMIYAYMYSCQFFEVSVAIYKAT